MEDVLIALHHAARQFGIRRMSERLGKREKTLYSKLDPADDLHMPTIGEFVAILHLLDEQDQSDIIDRLAGMFGLQVATRQHEAAPMNLGDAVIRSVVEHADVVRAYEHAVADGRVTDLERAEILRECREARCAIQDVEHALRAKS